MVSILQEAMNGCSTSVTEVTPGLLLKDAAYAAAAYVYYELSNYLSFKDWCVFSSMFCLWHFFAIKIGNIGKKNEELGCPWLMCDCVFIHMPIYVRICCTITD